MTGQPWDDREVDLIRYLADCRLSPEKIATALTLAGFPTRDQNTIQAKGYKLGVKWQGGSKRD